MNKNLKTVVAVAFAFGLGFGVSNFAMSEVPSSYRVATIDVQKLIESSGQFKALKNDQLKKVEDLKKFVETARADVEKQSSNENKQKLAKKYEASLAQKQKANAEEYSKKLTAMDRDISQTIIKEAENKKYDLVLNKNTVLYGGDDITASVSKLIK